LDHDRLPPLLRDRAFLGMTATQFLGAFNDNLFKQLVLLLCLDYVKAGGADFQPLALALFAIPFVLFSGLAGFLSDRTSKQRNIVWFKLAEIGVMGLGLGAFVAGGLRPGAQLAYVLVVLFFMSAQSAFFGPSKYGILPEMLRARDLPQANGLIQMTTFVAIIFGAALAGYAKDRFQGELWIVSAICIAIAIAGTSTSLLVRPTRVAKPGLRFEISVLGVSPDTRGLLRRDRELAMVLLVSTLFWFIGGVVQPAVNTLGKEQLGLSDSRTSVLVACMGVGIAVGCAIAGKASGRRVRFGLVTLGAWGIAACLLALAALGICGFEPPKEVTVSGPPPLLDLLWPANALDFLLRLTLTTLGVFGGLFVVPLQVVLQARPPEDQKGRMIGAMNLMNWIGIVASAAFLWGAQQVCEGLGVRSSWIFAALAALVVPIAVFYRPRDTTLGAGAVDSSAAS
jgi:acyl-[acyl-carrier-protein]-phospholipid O-acyltransferase/long-chain-fatty-acid--[acyl-carrier-protein] ligase